MLYKIIVGLLAGQASGFMVAPMVITPARCATASPVMQYGAGPGLPPPSASASNVCPAHGPSLPVPRPARALHLEACGDSLDSHTSHT